MGPGALLAAHGVTSYSAVLLQELCLYTLGNLVVESEAVRKQLLPQGIIPVLASCIQVGETAQPHFCCALERLFWLTALSHQPSFQLWGSSAGSCSHKSEGHLWAPCAHFQGSAHHLVLVSSSIFPIQWLLSTVCSTGTPVSSAWPGSSRAGVCRSKCSNQHFYCVWAKPSGCEEGGSSSLV